MSKFVDCTVINTIPSPYIHFNSFYLLSIRVENPSEVCVTDFLINSYPWIKSGHIIAVIAWMAGLFYLPRLFVYHAGQAATGSDADIMFQVMERRLLRLIMNPAMIAAWGFGVLLAATPGVVDWTALWPWAKLAGIVSLTWYHHWLARRRVDFVRGDNRFEARTYRIMNELPTVLVVIIVISVVARPI